VDDEVDDKLDAGFEDGEGERFLDNEENALWLKAAPSGGEETYDMNTEALELALSDAKKLGDRDAEELELGVRTNEVDCKDRGKGEGKGEVEGERLPLRLVENGVLGATLSDEPRSAGKGVPSPATTLDDGDGPVLELSDGLGLGDGLGLDQGGVVV